MADEDEDDDTTAVGVKNDFSLVCPLTVLVALILSAAVLPS